MKVFLLALFAILAASAAAAQLAVRDQPAVSVSGDRLLVALPGSVLKDRNVHGRLESGLTTTFILKVRLRGGAKQESVARIEIRYDLWDEVYRVNRNGGPALPIANAVLLEQWWRTPLDVMRVIGAHDGAELELIVLPFSAAEESDAREWLSKSGGKADPTSSSPGVVDVLIGTTLSARPVVSFHWTTELAARR